MIDRINSEMEGVLTTEAKNHWLGIARFFRAMGYASLVSVFGDVPYFDREVGSSELAELYKDRTPRNTVMEHVYNDFVFAMANVRQNDGVGFVNRDVVAGFVSRWALFEGTWQKYHYNNSAISQKFLQLAVNAGDMVMNSSAGYSFNRDFRSLFGSKSLSGGEVILYRSYSGLVSHSVGSSCNLIDGRWYGPSLSLVKSFICNDGTDWEQTDSDPENKKFDMASLIKTRDSRFEATFWNYTTYKSVPTCIYVTKFINRAGTAYVDAGLTQPEREYTGMLNENGYPVMRLGEVVLNWIEAKAELDPASVTQTDINRSINAIRSRPIAAEALARGVKATAPLDLFKMPKTPVDTRGDIDQLIWEIRRERRMELAFEYCRLMDLKRWKKLEYMDGNLNPDILKGTWVKLSEVRHLAENWREALIEEVGVADWDGNETLFDGSNPDIEGFYFRRNVANRLPFLNEPGVNPYLAPVGRNQRIDYQNKGFKLSQTTGWPQELN